MSKGAMFPCIVCGEKLDNVLDTDNQPSEGTIFTTMGHYGSTFWDSFQGERLEINVCDECLRKNTDKIGRQKVYVNLVVETEPGKPWKSPVGRQWVERELVPYFDGPEDDDAITIEPEEIGALQEQGYSRIEWIRDWELVKKNTLERYAEWDKENP